MSGPAVTGTLPVEGGGLQALGVTKRYAGVPVLKGVSVTVRSGEVVGLVGHNGAGKSTFLRVLAGATRPDEGTLQLDGRALSFGSPADALGAGIATVYQELSLLANLSVTQNVYLGHEDARSGLLQRERMRRHARELVERFQIEVDVDRQVGDYPVATRQLLEIAIATHRNARYLLLDEPTTSLEGSQIELLLGRVRALARDDGLGILLVNHKLEEMYAVSDRIVALVDGQVRIDSPVGTVSRADVVRAIAGEDHVVTASDLGRRSAVTVAPSPAGAHVDGVPSLAVRNLRTRALADVTLHTRPGRVLGLYGLVGSGRTEFLRSLVGLDTILGGEIELAGKPYRPRNPGTAQRVGLVYVTEERKTDGIVPALDSAMNVSLPILARYSRVGFLNRRAMSKDATAAMDRLRVKGNRLGPIVSLSGGNQQKVLLARALGQEPTILLLDEPTKGVDLGVKAEIHRIVRALAHDQDLTIVLVSSEEDEIIEVADDVAIFALGRCTGETWPASSLTAAGLRRTAWDAA